METSKPKTKNPPSNPDDFCERCNGDRLALLHRSGCSMGVEHPFWTRAEMGTAMHVITDMQRNLHVESNMGVEDNILKAAIRIARERGRTLHTAASIAVVEFWKE